MRFLVSRRYIRQHISLLLKSVFLLLLIILSVSTVYSSPKKKKNPSRFPDLIQPTGAFIYDRNDIVSDTDKYNLQKQIDSLYKKTGIEVNLVALGNERNLKLYPAKQLSDSIYQSLIHAKQKLGIDPCILLILYVQDRDSLYFHTGSHLRLDSIFTKPATTKLTHQYDSISQNKTKSESIAAVVNSTLSLAKPTRVINKDNYLYGVIVGFAILFLTIYLCVLWTKWIGRRTAKLTSMRRRNLKKNQIYAVLFFMFLYGLISMQMVFGLEYLFDLNLRSSSYFIVPIMLLGWILPVSLLALEKTKYPPDYSDTAEFENFDNIMGKIDKMRLKNQPSQSGQSIQSNLQSIDSNIQRVFMNIATASEIMSLSSIITKVDANKIIKERETKGDFADINDFQKRTHYPAEFMKKISNNIDFKPSDNPSRNEGGKRVIDF